MIRFLWICGGGVLFALLLQTGAVLTGYSLSRADGALAVFIGCHLTAHLLDELAEEVRE